KLPKGGLRVAVAGAVASVAIFTEVDAHLQLGIGLPGREQIQDESTESCYESSVCRRRSPFAHLSLLDLRSRTRQKLVEALRLGHEVRVERPRVDEEFCASAHR